MKAGDKIKALVQVGLMKNPDWLRGTVIASNRGLGLQELKDAGFKARVKHEDEYLVEVSGNRLVVTPDKVRLWEPLEHDADGPVVREFAERNWLELKRHVAEAARHFLPGDDVKINEEDKTITINDVTVAPNYTEVRSIAAFREVPCWTVSYWQDVQYSRLQPPDSDEVICGNSMSTIGAARLLIDSVLKARADGYWDAVADDEMARSFTEDM